MDFRYKHSGMTKGDNYKVEMIRKKMEDVLYAESTKKELSKRINI